MFSALIPLTHLPYARTGDRFAALGDETGDDTDYRYCDVDQVGDVTTTRVSTAIHPSSHSITRA